MPCLLEANARVCHTLRQGLRKRMPPVDYDDRGETALVQLMAFAVILAGSAVVMGIARCFGCIGARECDSCLGDCFFNGCVAMML